MLNLEKFPRILRGLTRRLFHRHPFHGCYRFCGFDYEGAFAALPAVGFGSHIRRISFYHYLFYRSLSYYFVDCADKERWGVEQIKELLYSLNLTSCYGAGRVILFNDAELMNAASANSLLKSLEEPRPNTWFILVTANPSKLLPTIVSRSQSWFFNLLSNDEVRLVLERGQTAITELSLSLEELVVLADGAPGSIAGIRDRAAEWTDLKMAMNAIRAGDVSRAVSLAAELAKDKDKESLREKIKLLRIYARHRMHETPGASWALCVSNLISAERLIFERNLNAQYILSTTLLNLAVPDAGSFTPLTNSATLLERIVA